MKKPLLLFGILGVLVAVSLLFFVVSIVKKEASIMMKAPLPLELEVEVEVAAEAPPPAEKLYKRKLPTPELSDIVENEIKKLTPGRILFNPPTEMKVGVKERVEARIAKTITEDLSKGLKGRGLPQIEEIRVNTLMEVRLSGDNFDIKSLSDMDQIVTREGFTQWDWYVMPLKSGVQSLLLTVTVRIKIPNYDEERKNYPVFERKIKVKVNPPFTIKKFIESYWQWIIGTIIIPVIVWIAKKWLASKKK